MKHVIKSAPYVKEFKIYTLDCKSKGQDENAQLISSKEGKELQEDIDAVVEIVNR